MDRVLQAMEDVWIRLNPIGITDIIDILIIAFIIYKVIMLIRRTSSGSVAKGILVVVVALLVSQLARLNTVSYLLGKLVEYGVVALVVLFHP